VTDSTHDSADEPAKKRRSSWKQIRGVNTLSTPTSHWFDPPLEPRSYEEIVQEVRAAMKAIERRRFGRKKDR
jgi:hypothetical protein